MKFTKSKLILLIPVIIIVLSAIFIAANSKDDETTVITGVVETQEIDVASKIAGRIESLRVEEGAKVNKGDTLAIMESKEIDAKVNQAKSAMEAAESKMELVKKGARKEKKEAAEKLYNKAKHQYEYVKKTWERMKKLRRDSVISQQKFDEIDFKYNAAKEEMEAAEAKYDMVMKGAREEEISATEALYRQAKNAYNEALAYKKELTITSPINGEISNKIIDAGEVIAAGYPIISIQEPKDVYVVIQLREDYMSNIEKGDIIEGRIPSMNNEISEFEINYIAPMADFATWRPTNQKSEFDLKTFELHLKPLKDLNSLCPGMTVNFKIPTNEE
jgi:HlyD family secretion protein